MWYRVLNIRIVCGSILACLRLHPIVFNENFNLGLFLTPTRNDQCKRYVSCVWFIVSLISITELTRTNVPSPQTNPACPPPINWSTKPNRKRQDTGTLDGSDFPFTVTPPADSVTDGSGERHQLALLLRHLGHSVAIVDATSQQDGADSRGVHSSVSVDNTMHELEAALHQLESKEWALYQ